MSAKKGYSGKLVYFMAVQLLGILTLSRPGSSMAAGYVLPDTGQTQCYNNNYGGEIDCPKRGEQFFGQDGNYDGPPLSYRDNGDGTVTDRNTGLMWQQDDAHNARTYSWQRARNYCEILNLARHTDWRLPAIGELASLINIGKYNPAIDTTYFPGCLSDYYWSGTPYSPRADYAWGAYFSMGNVGYGSKRYAYYVRCVRGGR